MTVDESLESPCGQGYAKDGAMSMMHIARAFPAAAGKTLELMNGVRPENEWDLGRTAGEGFALPREGLSPGRHFLQNHLQKRREGDTGEPFPA
jgi:hypothetical protein